jgi:glucose dehydrogenase
MTILLSTITASIASAAPLSSSEENGHYVNGNSWAWNYSPQTQINKNNVDQLEVKWIFPIESKSQGPEALNLLNLWEGVTTPPVVNDGVVYIQTNFLKTYAVDTKTGRQLWTHNYIINVTEIQRRLPWVPRGLAHLHGIRYWESGDAVLLLGYACDMYALDGKTGNETLHIKDLCLNIPGNIYPYSPAPEQNAIGTYEKGRQFIFLLSHVEGGGWVEGGRNVAMGVDMDTKKVLWRVFNAPPQDRPSKDWALEECDRGFFRDIPCRDVAANVSENLEWDWAPAEGEPPHPSSGVTAAWGQPVVDLHICDNDTLRLRRFSRFELMAKVSNS